MAQPSSWRANVSDRFPRDEFARHRRETGKGRNAVDTEIPDGVCSAARRLLSGADAADTDSSARFFLPSARSVSPLPQTPFGLFGNFVFVLAPDGTLVSTRGFDTGPFGGAPSPPATGVAFDPSGRVALSGMFNDTVDFGTGPMTAPGQIAHNGSGPSFIPDNVFTLLLAP
jgi:hypothetical protein